MAHYKFIKFTFAMTVFTIVVAISMLIGIALTYQSEIPESGIVETPEEETRNHISFTSSAPVESVDEQGALSAAVEIGGADSEMSATAPVGVQLAEGATSLTLNVNEMADSQADVTAGQGVNHIPLDVHVDGVAEGNSVPMTIKLTSLVAKALNSNNIALYHVENGQTVAMTLVDEAVNHNEFSYDPATGDIYLCMASFSEVSVVANTVADWDGTVATSFRSGTGTEADPYTIANAEQFAYFRNLVDGGNKFETVNEDGSVTKQYVKLENDINLRWLDSNNYPHSFDPIGWGYDRSAFNKGGAEGKTFNGIFDGNGKTIFNLYQNGWDLDPDKTNYSNYSYTNCGGGLFGAICNATIKNLTISSADVKFECVEIGILVGLAQGNCTFENITVRSSKIANYQRPTGGLVGEVSPKYNADGTAVASTHTFSNITIASDVVVGSLWGDFDAPVGGLIGAYWDDAGVTKVNISDSSIAARLDVYNDVTSSYQWYAYRRAGMLIGNTDRSVKNESGTNVASTLINNVDFLTCSNVHVYYGNWANYTYCEFSTAHNTYNRWPWVRCQEGENNGSYSNVRYGHPKDAIGAEVYFDVHNHADGEGHLVSIPFNQLYGGGQGVYGQPQHAGVTIHHVAYTITYIIDGEVYAVKNVSEEEAKSAFNVNGITIDEATKNNRVFQCWLDIDSQRVDEIKEGNTENITLYCSWDKILIARFLYNDGSVYAEVEFTNNGGLVSEEPKVPQIAGYHGTWEPYADAMKEAKSDIVIKPMYTVDNTVEVLPSNFTLAQLFAYLEDGKKLAMSQDMTGKTSGGNDTNQCTISNQTARLNLNTYELSYAQGSSAAKDWRLFTITSNGVFTLGTGINGTGKLTFNIDTLNKNADAQIFVIQQGGQLVLEKGVVIEINFDAADESKITLITGITDLDTVHYPGLHITTTEAVNGRKSYIIEVYNTTTLTGNDSSVRVN